MKTGPVATIAFAPDGRLLAAASTDAVSLWDIATGKEVHRQPIERVNARVYFSSVRSLAFAPGGRSLVTGLIDSSSLVWDVSAARPAVAKTQELQVKELERAWTDLAGDATTAWGALAALTASPAQTIALFNDRQRPAADAPAERLRRLLADLDSLDFTTREAADRELKQLGDLAGPALRRALADKPALEVRRRIESILSAIRFVRQPEALRRLRAVHVLEQIDTPEARQILRKLAEGSSAARETAAARDAQTRGRRTKGP